MDVVEPAVVVSGGEIGANERRPPAANGAAEASAAPAQPVSVQPVSVQPVSVQPVSVQHRLEFAALRAVCALARLAPIRLVTTTGAAIAWSIGPWLRQNRRALANLAIAFPDKTAAEHRRIARAMWANMGRIFAETLILDRIIANPSSVELVNLEQWQERFTAAGPAIGCTLHMGNWELAIWPFHLLGRNPVGVYKPLDNPLADAWLRSTRSPLCPGGLLGKGANGDDTKAGQHTARQLINIARRGGAIGFVSDHIDRRGDPIPFMGREARFTTAPAMIARHVGARFWVGRCVRIGKASRFRMEMHEFAVPATKDKAADARALTAATFAQFEAWIREVPEQWMWWNTRWVRPDAPVTAPPVHPTGPVP